MRLPSIKTIQTNFDHLSKEDVKKVRKTLENYCHQPINCLKKLDPILGGFGLEYISDKNDDVYNAHGIEFINMGDSYVATFCYDNKKGQLFISSWGDIVEKNPKRFGFE